VTLPVPSEGDGSSGGGEPSAWFGSVATAYARHRLTYPEAFFDAFRDRLPRGSRSTVWDCGCGNGQASLAMAGRVRRVIATDASAAQLAQAFPHPAVVYRQATADASGLPDGSVDGVLVAAAIHWFAGDAFEREVRRVCRAGAAMAWIGYHTPRFGLAGIQGVCDAFDRGTLAPWWPPQRRWVDQAYQGLRFPGTEWPFPEDLCIERLWTLQELIASIGTWSAVQRCRQSGQDPLPELEAELRRVWPGAGAAPIPVRWPFMGRWGRVE
jgi:ubiquinone/menaquinone biosynthesis C-methylase UbiE